MSEHPNDHPTHAPVHTPPPASSARPWTYGVVWAAATIAFVTLAWRFLTFSGFTNDHYVHVARAQQMLLGEWPVRDFVDPGLPLMYVVSALGRVVLGRGMWVEWLIVAAALGCGAAMTMVTARRLSGSIALGLTAALLEVAAAPRSFSYPKIMLYAIAGWAFVAYARRPTSRAAGGLGMLTALAFLFRHDHGLFIGLGSAVVMSMSWWRHRHVVRWRQIAPFVLVTAVLLLPWAVFVQRYAGLSEYFHAAMAFSRREAELSVLRALPAFTTESGLLTDANAQAWLFYLCHALPVVCMVVALGRLRDRTRPDHGELTAVVAIAAMAVPMNVGFLRDALSTRIPDAVVPAVVLGAWLASRRPWRGRRGAVLAHGLVVVALLIVTVGAIARVARVDQQLEKTGLFARAGAVRERVAQLLTQLSREMPEGSQIPSRYAAALMPFFAYLERCTTTNDRLMVTGLHPEIFVLANRGFSGGQMALLSGFYASDADQRLFIARSRTQSVPFVVSIVDLEPTLMREMPLVMAEMTARYRALAHIEVPETPGLRLYVDREWLAVGVDEVTGWPCVAAH